MKKPMLRFILAVGLPALLVMAFCTQAWSGEPGVTQRFKKANTPFDQTRVQASIALPDNTVLVTSRYQGGRFWTETRKDKIERFKCSQCHNNKPVTIANATKMAHGEIVLDHGGREKPLSCFTCHNKEQRDRLVTEAGGDVDMDHSYVMCGQCHFRQKKDWVGGAHGKRIGYWAGKRVVKSCTSCHDPHSPLFKKQWPRTYSPPIVK